MTKATKRVSSNGMIAKVAFVNSNFALTGKKKSEAVKGLQSQYPQMSKNYAHAVVYRICKEKEVFWTNTLVEM